MIPVDLSANCDGWIYDPNGSGIQILGIRSRDPFSGSTDMSGNLYSYTYAHNITHKQREWHHLSQSLHENTHGIS